MTDIIIAQPIHSPIYSQPIIVPVVQPQLVGRQVVVVRQVAVVKPSSSTPVEIPYVLAFTCLFLIIVAFAVLRSFSCLFSLLLLQGISDVKFFSLTAFDSFYYWTIDDLDQGEQDAIK